MSSKKTIKHPLILEGCLHAFSETGSEGTHWSFIENGKEGYDALHAIKSGDFLRVFNNAAEKKEIWSGVIDYDYKANKRPLHLAPHIKSQWIDTVGSVHGIQKNIDPEKWAQMFIEEKPAQLIRKNPQQRY
jgi:hypothetical protein